MTTEQKAKAYDKALEKARQLCAYPTTKPFISDLQDLFPELAEPEDEKTRKEIMEYITLYKDSLGDDEYRTWLAWLKNQGEPIEINPSEFDLRLNKLLKQFEALPKEELANSLSFYLNVVQNNGTYNEEKQAEQKLPIEKLPSEMKTIGESLGFTTQEECDKYNQMVSDLIMPDGNEIKPKFKVDDTIRLKNSTAEYTIESISGGCYHGRGWGLNIIDADKSGDYVLVEQKPANKIEPKFRVGDWAVSPNGVYWHIDAIQNGRYEVTANTGQCGNWPLDTNIYRLWTIYDAKDGDVLTNGDFPCIFKRCDGNGSLYVYCGINAHNDFSILSEDSENIWDDYSKQYFPATKEQCDLLFQKMYEAGYEWDAEKKELKKIEQKPAEWKQENVEELSEFENAMMHIGYSFFGKRGGLDPNDTSSVKVQAQYLLELAQKPAKWNEEDETNSYHLKTLLENLAKDNEHKFRVISDNDRDKYTDWLKSIKQRIGG